MPDQAPLQPLVLLEDEPVRGFKDDGLGVEPFARVIAGTAIGTDGPFTIGVFANWGEGKTSLLRQAKTLVDEYQPDVVTVWFNAWQYEKEEHPIVPLVASIVRAVEQKLETLKKSETQVRTALSSVSRALRAIAYGFSAKAKVTVPGFAEVEAGFVAKEMIDRYDKLASAGDPLLDRTLYYNAFETLERVAGEHRDDDTAMKIVVFIDDLDRCLPPQALKLLESIKLVLAQRGFIFALAVDRRVLESFLSVRYQKEYGVSDYQTSGTQYLDKIVQLPLPMPPHRARFRDYIDRLIQGPVFQHTSNMPVRDAVNQLAEVLAAGSNYNPRNLVRFLNNLIVDRQIWLSVLKQQGERNPESQIDADRLGLCAVSRIMRQHLGDWLYRWLVGAHSVCDKLADGTLTRDKDADSSKSTLLSFEERSTRELLRRLDESPFLSKLLATGLGKRWLTEHELRQEVDEFLVQEREAQDEGEGWDNRRFVELRVTESVNSSDRERAVWSLVANWADETTRKLLAERAVKDAFYRIRRDALYALAKKWPDETTRKLLAERAVEDESVIVRLAALAVLAERWSDETTQKLLTERAVDAKLSEDRRGEHCFTLARMHSKFGGILLSRDCDGRYPFLDPREPISSKHVMWAAQRAVVPADKIDEMIKSLSEHLGWDIMQGLTTRST